MSAYYNEKGKLNVALPTINSIELCAGVGMLGEGVSAGFEFVGIRHRTVCYVEREAAAASQLVALMEAGALNPAPIWSDMLTFDGAAWRERVDCVIAGFPCQDLSIAGRRAGLDGKRSGLFFTVLDIADACGAWCLVLENVRGIASATATVVDEAEGEIEERAASRVLGELADRGWNAEWITLPASDVGASHDRHRWFCFAWRDLGNTGLQHLNLQQRTHGTKHSGAGQYVDNAGCLQRCSGHEQDRPGGAEASGHQAHDRSTDGSSDVAHAERAERRPERIGSIGSIQGDDGRRSEKDGRAGVADAALADAKVDHGRSEFTPGGAGCRGCGPAGSSRTMGHGAGVGQADASSSRCEGCEQRRACDDERHGTDAHGPAGELLGALPLFAPGPLSPLWGSILSAGRIGAWQRAVTDDEAGSSPWAPATKPGVRVLADGLAILVDESRNHQLRQVGNGVVPLQAAVALVLLARRAAVFERKQPPAQSRRAQAAINAVAGLA